MIPILLPCLNWKWAAPAAVLSLARFIRDRQTLRLSWLQAKFEKAAATIQLIDATKQLGNTAQQNSVGKFRQSKSQRTVTMKSRTSMLAAMLCLCSCGTVHVAPPPPPPKAPSMDKLPADVLDPAFMHRMQNFLSGRLPGPTP